MPELAKRSFWLHQLAEYMVGVALLATGLPSASPLVPSILGGLIICNVAVVKGPFSAFRWVSRGIHHVLDYVIVVAAVLACGVPNMDIGARLVQLMIGLVLATIVWRTDYTVPAPKTKNVLSATSSGKADTLGRLAGRSAGTLAAKIRAKVKDDKSA